MAIFKSKPTTSDEILKAIADLSEDERAKFEQSYKDRLDESVGEQEAETDTEDTQTAEDRVDEAEGEAEAVADEEPAAEETEEVEETAEEEAEGTEEEGEVETRQEQEDEDERYEVVAGRVDALEEQLAKATETINALMDMVEKGSSFGLNPSAPKGGEERAETEDDKVMRAYYGAKYRK